jgi:hypothetical protein
MNQSRTSSPVRIPRDNETLQHPPKKTCIPVVKALVMLAAS